MQVNIVPHPLPIDTYVKANRPSCACRGAKIETVEGKIKKVISNQAGVWYYLDGAGVTVKSEWVTEVLT